MKALFFFIAILGSLLSVAKEKKTILHSNGRVQYEYEMEGHLLDGNFSCYYENGKLRIKGQFSGNQKTGLWRVWDEKGKLRSERNYVNNQSFTLISECDSTGTKTLRSKEQKDKNVIGCNFESYLFSQRYISSIAKNEVNSELFAEDGLICSLIANAPAFSDERFTQPLNPSGIFCYRTTDILEILVKEQYDCCAKDQVMVNRLMGVGIVVVMDNGQKKELWYYAPDITVKAGQLNKIKQHQYAATIVKTTVHDASFRLREVSAKENDLLRLMLVEFEANAILYTIDNNQVVATNQ